MGSPLFNQPAYSSQVPISWISSPQLQNSPPMAHFFFHVHLVHCLKKDNPLRKTVLKQKTKKEEETPRFSPAFRLRPFSRGFWGAFNRQIHREIGRAFSSTASWSSYSWKAEPEPPLEAGRKTKKGEENRRGSFLGSVFCLCVFACFVWFVPRGLSEMRGVKPAFGLVFGSRWLLVQKEV